MGALQTFKSPWLNGRSPSIPLTLIASRPYPRNEASSFAALAPTASALSPAR